MCSIALVLALLSSAQEKSKSVMPDPPLCLKTKDGGFVCVESNRTVVFMVDKDGTVKWVSRDWDSRENTRIVELYDTEGAKKRGVNMPGGLPADHIFIDTRPRIGKGPSDLSMLSLADGKCKFSLSD
jgi:hypothetical protein